MDNFKLIWIMLKSAIYYGWYEAANSPEASGWESLMEMTSIALVVTTGESRFPMWFWILVLTGLSFIITPYYLIKLIIRDRKNPVLYIS